MIGNVVTHAHGRSFAAALIGAGVLLLLAAPAARGDHGPPPEQELFARADSVIVGVVREVAAGGRAQVEVTHALAGAAKVGANVAVDPAATDLCACDGDAPALAVGQTWLLFLAKPAGGAAPLLGHADNAWLCLPGPDEPGHAAAVADIDRLAALAAGSDDAEVAERVKAAEGNARPSAIDRYLIGCARWRAKRGR